MPLALAYAKGERIFDRSDTSDDVYFIVEGKVRAVDHTKSGQEVAFIEFGTGDLFGEFSAISAEPRSATVYALEDSVTAVVPGEAFIAFLRNRPEVASGWCCASRKSYGYSKDALSNSAR